MKTWEAGRWELGSEFHLILPETSANTKYPWDENGHALFGAGRDATTVLLKHGMASRGWKRFWIPDYFCQEVVKSFVSTGIEVKLYPDLPINNSLSLELVADQFSQGDVVLIVNYYGLRSRDSIQFHEKIYSIPGIEIIEDHTHDLSSSWAFNSKADWCMASLRKTLPVADGGVLWSPIGNTMPETPPVEKTHILAVHDKLSAMFLKKLYLEGNPIEKKAFCELADKAYSRSGFAEPSGISQWSAEYLGLFPALKSREIRRQNHNVLCNELAGLSWLEILKPDDVKNTCPFMVVLVFDSNERREQVREKLIEADVYPSVLWPLEEVVLPGVSKEAIDFSRLMLSVHCDLRYDGDDMKRAASIIKSR
ncbi:MAG: hypothetical protein HY779_04495 [Rubrobacteridae bacterium]|nr:hypothetical protein [Rubrobacteridae bacterium]